MALTVRDLGNYSSVYGNTVSVTCTPDDDSIVIMWGARNSNSSLTSVSGGGATWTQLVNKTAAGGSGRLAIYIAYFATSPGSVTLSMAFSGNSVIGGGAFEFTDLGGRDDTDFIVQQNADSTQERFSSGTGTGSLGTFADSGNWTLMIGHSCSNSSPQSISAPKAGYSVIGTPSGGGAVYIASADTAPQIGLNGGYVAHPWACFELNTVAVGGGGSYTLTSDSGSFSLSGSAAVLSADRFINGQSGAFSFSGSSTQLRAARKLSSTAGSFSLNGTQAAIRADRKLSSGSGAIALTGSNAGLVLEHKVQAQSGSFSFSGTDANLYSGALLSADSGGYVLTGSDAGISISRRLAGQSGSYQISGSASLSRGYVLNSDTVGYNLTGSNIGLVIARKIQAQSGSFAFSGSDLDLDADSNQWVFVPPAGNNWSSTGNQSISWAITTPSSTIWTEE